MGILGTTINNRLRMRELRDLVSRSASGERLMDVSNDLSSNLKAHEDRLEGLVAQVQQVMAASNVDLARVAEVQALSSNMEALGQRMTKDERATSVTSKELVNRTDDIYKAMIAQQDSIKASDLIRQVRSSE